jgi:hypothetical protein
MQRAQLVGIPTEDPTILHVHHTFYIFGNLPWEYNYETLKTVCHNCHCEIRSSENIPVYSNKNMKEKLSLTVCPRCNGTGFLKEYHYFKDGVCFSCQGRKYLEFIK